jgi:hypothetical protein
MFQVTENTPVDVMVGDAPGEMSLAAFPSALVVAPPGACNSRLWKMQTLRSTLIQRLASDVDDYIS